MLQLISVQPLDHVIPAKFSGCIKSHLGHGLPGRLALTAFDFPSFIEVSALIAVSVMFLLCGVSRLHRCSSFHRS